MGVFFDYDWHMYRFLEFSRENHCRRQPSRLAWVAPSIIFAFILSACAGLPTAPPMPPTQWLRAQISPALAEHTDLYSTCTPDGTGLAIQQVAGSAFDADQVDIKMHWGPISNDQGYTAQIGEEELVMVVHPNNPIENLNLAPLRNVFSGTLPAWDWDYLGQAPQNLTVYAYPSASDIQIILASQLLSSQQPLPREVVIEPGPAEMRSALAADPGGLGFLPRGWVDASVKIVPIPDLPTGAWTKPILAMSAVEPQGPAREWLLCVQQGLEQ